MSKNTRDIQALLRQEVVPEGSRRYGVVIGIESYADKRLDLKCARADAEAMYELMIEPDCGMFAADDVTLLLNDAATKKTIWNALATLRRKAGKNDTVWVYYAGHAAPEDNDFYWVPFDCNVDDLYATGLSRRQISQVLDDISAERIVTFLDCCHAAATAVQKNNTRNILTAEQMLSGYNGKGRVIISASDGEEKSIELPDKGHGAFTHYLTKGLRGAADLENTGVVHLDGLWAYLESKVSDVSQKAGNRQTPKLFGEHSHKLALSLNPLETKKKRQIADKIRELVGLDDDQLTTTEARYCLEMLRRNPQNDVERDVATDFGFILDGSIRIVTFKRLIQAAMNAKETQQSRPQPTQHSLPLANPENKITNSDQKSSKAIELDTIRKRNIIDEKEALQLIDAWSIDHPEYLNPISQHAELIEFKNWGGFVIQVQALVETREVELNQEPYSGNSQDVQTERIEDKWDVPMSIPSGFKETVETYVASIPQRILTCNTCGGKGDNTCKKCNGVGELVCNKCNGTGVVMCPECDGTGNDPLRFSPDGRPTGKGFHQKRKCVRCHGKKILPCKTCKGVPKWQCTNCGATGKTPCKTCASSGQLAEVPSILVSFLPTVTIKTICENINFSGDLSTNASGTSVFHDTSTSQEFQWRLDGFPIAVAKQSRIIWKKVVDGVSGKIHRIKLAIKYVPCVTVAMQFKSAHFSFNIIGAKHRISTSGNIPKDTLFIKQKNLKELHIKLLNCQKKLPAAKIAFSLLLFSTIICIAGIGLCLDAEVVSPVIIGLILFGIFSIILTMAKLFSDEVGPGLLKLLSEGKSLKQELAWEEQNKTKE